jgi:hypothetical protein
MHADMLDSTPFTPEPSGLSPVSLSPTPVAPKASPSSPLSRSAVSPPQRDPTGAENHHRKQKMPRVPFQFIDLTALHIQNSTVTPARKPVFKQCTERTHYQHDLLALIPLIPLQNGRTMRTRMTMSFLRLLGHPRSYFPLSTRSCQPPPGNHEEWIL